MLDTNFQLKMTVLIFWTKFAQKGYFWSKTEKLHFLRASMVVTYYIKLFYMGADRQNDIFISFLLLVTEKIRSADFIFLCGN